MIDFKLQATGIPESIEQYQLALDAAFNAGKASAAGAMQAEIDELRAALGRAKRLTEQYSQETRWQGGRIRELTDELANRDAKLAALAKQEPYLDAGEWQSLNELCCGIHPALYTAAPNA